MPKRKYFTPLYRAYMRSEAWKIKRRLVLQKFGYRCAACGSKSRLEVHHLSYINFTRELLSDLIPLCKGCHAVADHVRRLTRK